MAFNLGLKLHDLVRGFPVRENEVLVQAGSLVEAILVERKNVSIRFGKRVMHVRASSRVLLTQPESRGLVCDVRQSILKFGKCV